MYKIIENKIFELELALKSGNITNMIDISRELIKLAKLKQLEEFNNIISIDKNVGINKMN